MKVRLRRSALEDLASARKFYDPQEIGIGDYFLDSLITDVDSLALYGGIHRFKYGFHRMLARRFPYAIYSKILAGEAVVFRILDCRRHPDWIHKNLN